MLMSYAKPSLTAPALAVSLALMISIPAQAETLEELVAKYKATPEFVAPGAAIDIKAILGGKTIYAIPATSANPSPLPPDRRDSSRR